MIAPVNLLHWQMFGAPGADGQNVQEHVDQERTAESDLVQEIDVQEHTNKPKTAITPHVLVLVASGFA